MASSSAIKPWSETRKGRILILAGMIGLFVLVFWYAKKARGIVTSPLVVDEQYLSFGEVWEDSEFVWTLPIHNISQEDVEIATVAADCPCGKVEPSSLTIPTKETREVRLTLDLRPRFNQNDLPEREFKLFVQPRLGKGPVLQSGWTIRGKVRSSITFNPRSVDFGDRLIRGQPNKPIIVQAKCHAPVSRLIVTGGEPFVQIKSTTIDSGCDGFQITVMPSNAIQVGVFNTDVIVQPIAMASGALPKVKLPVTGVVLPDVGQLIPARVVLGARAIGETVTETIIVRSLDKKQIVISEVSSNSHDLTVNALGKDEEGNLVFQLKVRITKERNFESDVVFFLRRQEKKEASSIALPVSYFGVAAGRSKK